MGICKITIARNDVDYTLYFTKILAATPLELGGFLLEGKERG